jgi:hypothetical protein
MRRWREEAFEREVELEETEGDFSDEPGEKGGRGKLYQRAQNWRLGAY